MRRFPDAGPWEILGLLLSVAMVVTGALAFGPALAQRRAYLQMMSCQEPGGPPGCLPAERAEVTRIAEAGDAMGSYHVYYLNGESEYSFTDFSKDLVRVGANIAIVRWRGRVLAVETADGWVVTYKPGSQLLVYVYLALILFGAWLALLVLVNVFVSVPLRLVPLVEAALPLLLVAMVMVVSLLAAFGLATWLGVLVAALCAMLIANSAWDNRESTRRMWRRALGRDDGPAR
ncbi:hypothetical protein QEZ54_34670 [Catellatospora sp. KI3]|uniref:hypothetical protein n=1 Tax=Catellatospora sp. KI3 TaxID=3041620 RepID=UPI0024828850|nr:hypothetical protein [Catellatospora sp. KI3]MDI1466132.1 hypothetical protein [Catellatospora sp. KI3]